MPGILDGQGQIPIRPLGVMVDVPEPLDLPHDARICPLMLASRFALFAAHWSMPVPGMVLAPSAEEEIGQRFAMIADVGLCVADRCNYAACPSSAAALEARGVKA